LIPLRAEDVYKNYGIKNTIYQIYTSFSPVIAGSASSSTNTSKAVQNSTIISQNSTISIANSTNVVNNSTEKLKISVQNINLSNLKKDSLK
jgi:hypothetical protein